VAVPVTPSLPEESAPAPEPVVEEEVKEVEAVVEVAPESFPPKLTPERPPEDTGKTPVASAPSGLRCLYRGKTGQCTEMAAAGTTWCQPHKEKLLGVA
jgi:hypothetical protein